MNKGTRWKIGITYALLCGLMVYSFYSFWDFQNESKIGLSSLLKVFSVNPFILGLVVSIGLFLTSIGLMVSNRPLSALKMARAASLAGWFFYLPSTCAAFSVALFLIFSPRGLLSFVLPFILLILVTRHSFVQIKVYSR